MDPNPPGVGIYELGGGDIVAPTDVKNPATYRGIMIDCVLGSSLSANWRSPNRFVMVNCKAHLVRWGTSDAANGLNQNTYTSSGDFYTVAANCEVFVDATSLSPSASNTFPTFYAASPSSRYDLYFSHCRFIFRMADKNIALSFVNQNQVSTSTGHGNSILHNCEFYALTIGESGILGADPLKNTTTLGFLNQAATATQGGFIGCAFHNFQAINTTAGVLGYNNSTYYDASNTPGFTSFLGFGIAHPALAGKGRPHPIPALAPTMDANGYPRPAGDYTLGPVLSPLTIRPTRAVPSYAPRT